MKHLFYEQSKQKRIKKIIDIFGKSWFRDKTILELGAAHGDIGIELLKLGSDVTFADARIEHLKSIEEKLKCYNYIPKLSLIDQNNTYDFGQKFDLVIHMAVLNYIENWQNDLKNALYHSNCMILETEISENNNIIYMNDKIISHIGYDSITKKFPLFTESFIENELKKLDCKFMRIDDPELNCQGYVGNDIVKLQYDWKHIKEETSFKKFHRRMWLVIR